MKAAQLELFKTDSRSRAEADLTRHNSKLGRLPDGFYVLAVNADHLPRLRRLLLQLALTGRLGGTQDPGTKALPPGWSWVPLAECVDILDARRLPINEEERAARTAGKDPAQLFPYYGATRQQGVIDGYLFDETLVLLGEDGIPFFDPYRPKAYVVQGKCWVNNHAHVLRPRIIEPTLLCHALNLADYTGRVTGTTRLKLTQGKMLDIPIPVPPSNKQKWLTEKVDQLMGLCDELEAKQTRKRDVSDRLTKAALGALTSAEGPEELQVAWKRLAVNCSDMLCVPSRVSELRQAIIDALTSGAVGGDSASKWPRVLLGDAVEDTKYGTAKKCDHDSSLTAVLRIPNVVQGYLDLHELKYAAFSETELMDLRLKPGDVLLVRSNGSKDLVGRACVVDSRAEGFAYAGYLIRLRVSAHRATPAWVALALRRSDVRHQIEGPIRTTSGVHNINTKELLGLSVPLPPLTEQRRIVARVEQLMALCDDLESKLRTRDETAAKLAAALVADALA